VADRGRSKRVCGDCGAALSIYGDEDRCAPCQRTLLDLHRSLPPIPAQVWADREIRDALAGWDFGTVARLVRRHAGLRQEEVAELTGLSQGFLSQLESGRSQLVNIHKIIGFLDGLDTPTDLRPVPGDRPRLNDAANGPATVAQQGSEVNYPQARATSVGVELWELHEVLRSRRVGADVLELAERAGGELDALFAELPPAALASELGRQLDHLLGWLRDPQPVAVRQRLCGLVGRLAGLRGWMSFDTSRLDAAEAWFAAGLSAAREADDHDLAGWLLGARSLIPIDRQDYGAAHGLLAEAQATAANASPTTRAWIAALDARALAGLGDHKGFTLARQQVDQQLPRTCLTEQRHGMDFAGEVLDVTYYEGLSHLLLNEPEHAGGSFRSALDNLPSARVKARSVLLLSVALAGAQGRQVDQAAAHASEALTLASDQPIERVWERATAVRRMLGPGDGTRAVHALDDHMAAFRAALDRATPDPDS
jgi:transcriptional regulator with XRE-family HTH domain